MSGVVGFAEVQEKEASCDFSPGTGLVSQLLRVLVSQSAFDWFDLDWSILKHNFTRPPRNVLHWAPFFGYRLVTAKLILAEKGKGGEAV